MCCGKVIWLLPQFNLTKLQYNDAPCSGNGSWKDGIQQNMLNNVGCKIYRVTTQPHYATKNEIDLPVRSLFTNYSLKCKVQDVHLAAMAILDIRLHSKLIRPSPTAPHHATKKIK
jgi:hypothetical protein